MNKSFIVDSSSIMDKNAMKIISSYIINNEEIDFILGTVKKENKSLVPASRKISRLAYSMDSTRSKQ